MTVGSNRIRHIQRSSETKKNGPSNQNNESRSTHKTTKKIEIFEQTIQATFFFFSIVQNQL